MIHWCCFQGSFGGEKGGEGRLVVLDDGDASVSFSFEAARRKLGCKCMLRF